MTEIVSYCLLARLLPKEAPLQGFSEYCSAVCNNDNFGLQTSDVATKCESVKCEAQASHFTDLDTEQKTRK